MMTYTYQFSGQIAVNADSESEAFEQVDELLGYDAFTVDNAEDYSIDEVRLVDTEEVEEC